MDGSHDEFGYALLLKVGWTGSHRIQVTVHRHEGASGVSLVRARVESLWQASLPCRCQVREQRPALPIVMGPAAMWVHRYLSLDPSQGEGQASRESRRGTLGVCATTARIQARA